jgi:Calcineurin-like phosphoesterase
MAAATLLVVVVPLLRCSLCDRGSAVVVAAAMNGEEEEEPNESEEAAVFPFSKDLYHAFLEPFRSYPCLPRRIHLAQASNVVGVVERSSALPNDADADAASSPVQLVVNMTVTFSLDYSKCGGGGGGGANAVDVSVVYGHDLTTIGTVPGHDPLQFNYTSEKTIFTGTFHSDWIYHVTIPNLRAGRKQYWYRIFVKPSSSSSTEQMMGPYSSSTRKAVSSYHRSVRGSGGYYLGETKTYTFYTPPQPGQPTTLALVGDLGQTSNSAQTILDIYHATRPTSTTSSSTATGDATDTPPPPVTQLLIAGDMAYADSNPRRWVTWMDLIEPLSRSLPIHVAAGNHEIECTSNTNDIFVPYENYFHNPNRIADAVMEPVSDDYRRTLWMHSCSAPSQFQGVYNYGNSFYSYQHGLAHIVVLNSYTGATVGSPQYDWFQHELEHRYDRTAFPWLIVSFHSPLYTTFLGHVDEIEALGMKSAMEPLLVKHGVNFIVSGKYHYNV